MLVLQMTLAFTRIVRDPGRLDVVFDLIDGLGENPETRAEVQATLALPHVAAAANQRIRLAELRLDSLAKLPSGSLGEAAGRFFRAHQLDPAALPRRKAEDDVAWLFAHLYETHDLWHVLTGFSPDVAGELGLQAFYLAQVEGSVALSILSAGLLNTLIYKPEERRERMAAITRGYAMGIRAKNIVGLDWDTLLGDPLEQVRALLDIDVDTQHDAITALTPQIMAA